MKEILEVVKRMDSVKYFAYGSNMCSEQMKERCPESKFISTGYLEGYKFVYDGYSDKRRGAVANVIQDGKSTVEGVIFEVTASDLKRLDKSEGCPAKYKRDSFNVKDAQGNIFSAYVYHRTGEKLGAPSEEYRGIILKSAEEHKLSRRYIEENLRG